MQSASVLLVLPMRALYKQQFLAKDLSNTQQAPLVLYPEGKFLADKFQFVVSLDATRESGFTKTIFFQAGPPTHVENAQFDFGLPASLLEDHNFGKGPIQMRLQVVKRQNGSAYNVFSSAFEADADGDVWFTDAPTCYCIAGGNTLVLTSEICTAAGRMARDSPPVLRLKFVWRWGGCSRGTATQGELEDFLMRWAKFL